MKPKNPSDLVESIEDPIDFGEKNLFKSKLIFTRFFTN